MLQLLNICFQLFFLVALGLFLKKKGYLGKEVEHKLNLIVTKVIIPFSLLNTSNSPYDPNIKTSVVIMFIVAVSYYIFAYLYGYTLGRFVYKEDKDAAKVFCNCIVFANTLFIGLPIINSVLGGTGVILCIIYNLVFNLFFYPIGVPFYDKKTKYSPALSNISSMIKDPPLIASIFTLFLYLTPYRLPTFIYDSLQLIANLMTPLSMILLGAMLSKAKIKDIFSVKAIYLISFSRLIFLPLIMFSFSLLFPDLKDIFYVATILTALPTGSLNSIYAKKYCNNIDIVNFSILQSMVLMLFTLPFWIIIAR
jgi:predicted permease